MSDKKETFKLSFKDFMYLTHLARTLNKTVHVQTTIDQKSIDQNDLTILATVEATIGFLNKKGLLTQLPVFDYEKADPNQTED